MQPTPDVHKRIKDLAEIYSKAKQMILLAEELDPSFRSNIMVFKELRDSNDHLMRLFEEWFVNGSSQDERYMLAQIDKARGHVFRAGYDAIDGIVVSHKIKVSRAMDKISNEAIDAVFPEYYEHASDVDLLNSKIANHRNDKDVADDSLQNLESYATDAAKVAEFCKNCLAKVPHMIRWDKKKRWGNFLEKVVLALVIGIVTAMVGSITLPIAERYFGKESSEKPVSVQNKTMDTNMDTNSISIHK